MAQAGVTGQGAFPAAVGGRWLYSCPGGLGRGVLSSSSPLPTQHRAVGEHSGGLCSPRGAGAPKDLHSLLTPGLTSSPALQPSSAHPAPHGTALESCPSWSLWAALQPWPCCSVVSCCPAFSPHVRVVWLGFPAVCTPGRTGLVYPLLCRTPFYVDL